MAAVHVLVPDGIDDPSRPSGGNAYDRRVCEGLAALGWSVHERAVPGRWPSPDDAARARLAQAVDATPHGALVLVDGLIASTAPEVLVPAARRVRLVVLVHLPLGLGSAAAERAECAVLSSAAAVVTTSAWARGWLLERYALPAARVHVAQPGVDAAALASGTAAGGELLCVATVAPHKGHDLLLAALGALDATADLPWRCTCVGSLSVDPVFVDRLARQAERDGTADRIRFTGPLVGAALAAAYDAADVLVLPSRGETYGMVLTEAVAHGLPAIATDVGGVQEALGRGTDGARPGLLVPPGDPRALASALTCWLTDGDLRERLRRAARERRASVPAWSATSDQVARALAEAAA
jgi:glycosyltransferase involved in cell wall biosynthesis